MWKLILVVVVAFHLILTATGIGLYWYESSVLESGVIPAISNEEQLYSQLIPVPQDLKNSDKAESLSTETCGTYAFKIDWRIIQKLSDSEEVEALDCTYFSRSLQVLTIREQEQDEGLTTLQEGWPLLDGIPKSWKEQLPTEPYALLKQALSITPEAPTFDWFPGERLKHRLLLQTKRSLLTDYKVDEGPSLSPKPVWTRSHPVRCH